MSAVLKIEDIKSSVEKVAKDYGLKRVILFGSYANGKPRRKSDIDLLVEYPDRMPCGKGVSLFTVYDIKDELENLTGKTIHLNTYPLPEDTFLEIEKEIQIYEKK